jgi:hypothetical protein
VSVRKVYKAKIVALFLRGSQLIRKAIAAQKRRGEVLK